METVGGDSSETGLVAKNGKQKSTTVLVLASPQTTGIRRRATTIKYIIQHKNRILLTYLLSNLDFFSNNTSNGEARYSRFFSQNIGLVYSFFQIVFVILFGLPLKRVTEITGFHYVLAPSCSGSNSMLLLTYCILGQLYLSLYVLNSYVLNVLHIKLLPKL